MRVQVAEEDLSGVPLGSDGARGGVLLRLGPDLCVIVSRRAVAAAVAAFLTR